MVQQPHVEVGNTAVDLTDGLAAGCYVAQVLRVGDIGGGGVFLSFCQVGFGCFLVAGGVVGGLGFEHGED